MSRAKCVRAKGGKDTLVRTQVQGQTSNGKTRKGKRVSAKELGTILMAHGIMVNE